MRHGGSAMGKGRIVIVGAGEQAEIAYEYFTHDSDLEVVAFAVERTYLPAEPLYGLPVVPFEELPAHYGPASYDAFVGVSSTHLNQVRERLYRTVKAQGYHCPSYVSSHAFCWRNVTIGENSFVFEAKVPKHHLHHGHNVTLWGRTQVEHRPEIEPHDFVSSHVVISGFCRVGERSFMGVNACVGDNRTIARDCVVGAGAVVVKDTAERGV